MITRNNYEIWFLDFAEGKLNPEQRKAVLLFVKENPDLQNELEGFDSVQLNVEKEKSVTGNLLKKKQSWLLEKYSKEELIFHVSENLLSDEELREWNDLIKIQPELLNLVHAEKQLVLKPLVSEKYDAKLTLKKNDSFEGINQNNYKEYFIQYLETKNLLLFKAIQNFIGKNESLRKEFELTQQLILKADSSLVFENKDQLKKKEKVILFAYWQYAAAAAAVVLTVLFFNPFENTQENIPLASLKDSSQLKSIIDENSNPSKNNATAFETHEGATEENLTTQQNSTNKTAVKQVGHKKRQQLAFTKVDKRTVSYIDQQRNLKDSLAGLTLPTQKQWIETAETKTEQPTNLQTTEKPLEFVAAVINKKYYEESTPAQEQSNTFYAMKNVVKSATNADISKKEDDEYKEFSMKLGKFGITRKKAK